MVTEHSIIGTERPCSNKYGTGKIVYIRFMHLGQTIDDDLIVSKPSAVTQKNSYIIFILLYLPMASICDNGTNIKTVLGSDIIKLMFS